MKRNELKLKTKITCSILFCDTHRNRTQNQTYNALILNKKNKTETQHIKIRQYKQNCDLYPQALY